MLPLRCNNIGGLEDRLINIEAELSSVNTLLRSKRSHSLPLGTATEDECSGACSAHGTLQEDSPCLSRTDHHIVCKSSNLTDRYHGPCTLVGLCHEFRENLLLPQLMQDKTFVGDESQKSRRQSRLVIDDATESLFDHICMEAGTEESFDLQADSVPIRLPPKQILLMSQTQFFQQADYATDLFVQSSLQSNIESVYSRPFTTEHEAWTVCFHTIILLALGLENSWQDCDSQIRTQLFRPFLLTVCSALSNPRSLMVAKLVNVQALALLASTTPSTFATTVTDNTLKSVAAQRYHPLGLAESIFAQACLLAKTMGLHQARSAREGVSPEEAHERFRVFRSLYLRDKSSIISRGSICWLPSIDCGLSLESDEYDSANPKAAARTQLARLEDESYRLTHSADSPRRCSIKYKSALLNIEQGLERWASTYEVFSSPYANTRDVDLELEFLAARIYVLRKSLEPNHIRRALDDSRASCLLVVISCGKHEPTMIEQLNTLLVSKSHSKSLARTHAGGSRKNGRHSLARSAERYASESVPARFHSLLDTFSVPAFFLLAENVIRPSMTYDGSKAEQDLNLLQKTCACFRDFDERNQANNHIHKVRQAFEGLLKVINLNKRSDQVQSPYSGMQQSTNTQTTPSKWNNEFGGHQQVSEFSSLPSPLNSSIPLPAWEYFPTNTASAITPDSSSAGNSRVLSPLDSYYQSYDPFQQNVYFPHMQQQMMHPQSSDSQYAGVSEVAMDEYADTGLPTQYLATNPAMSFDIAP